MGYYSNNLETFKREIPISRDYYGDMKSFIYDMKNAVYIEEIDLEKIVKENQFLTLSFYQLNSSFNVYIDEIKRLGSQE